MKKEILCFDLDNVLCRTVKCHYEQSKPIKKNINFVNKLYENGYYIKIFTARFMGRNNDNINIAKKQALILTKKQLLSWRVKYHKLIFGKPSFDIYIDDKSLFFKRNWILNLKKKLNVR